MKIADGIEMLEISGTLMGSPRLIHPTLTWDGATMLLVDTGFPGQTQLIRTAVEQAGCAFEKLNGIILTHHDIDHIGSLAEIVGGSDGRVKVLAYEEEIPYVDGSERPLKLAAAEARWDDLPDEDRKEVEMLRAAFEKSFTRVDYPLSDGEELPYAGGIRVIFTPGHTVGHISLYHQPSKTLISGDILRVEQGALVPAPARINFDTELMMKSLKKLAGLDIAAVICYHGGLFTEDPSQRIAQLAGI